MPDAVVDKTRRDDEPSREDAQSQTHMPLLWVPNVSSSWILRSSFDHSPWSIADMMICEPASVRSSSVTLTLHPTSMAKLCEDVGTLALARCSVGIVCVALTRCAERYRHAILRAVLRFTDRLAWDVATLRIETESEQMSMISVTPGPLS